MAEDSDEMTLGVQIANQFINTANDRIGKGAAPDTVANALRHAAGNFSAFVAVRSDDPEDVIDDWAREFKETMDYYLPLHRKNLEPKTGLELLVDNVKKEQ